MTEGTKLEFWYKSTDNKTETFYVGTSATGNATEDFTFGDATSASNQDWRKYSVTIPDGTKYVCLKYTSNKANLAIDDILVSIDPVLQSYSTTETTLTITGLETGTTYEYQIQSMMGDDLSDWTPTATFTTLVPVELELANDADNSTTIGDNDGELAEVTLSGRTLYTDGDWNTLCLPFSIDDTSGTPLEGFTIKELDTEASTYTHATGLDNGTLYLNFKNTASIEAGKPYIVRKLNTNSSTPKYTATSGTEGINNSFGYANLIDGITNNRWRTYFTSGTPAFCEFKANMPIIVTGYTLTSGNWQVNCDPKVWTLQAKLRANDEWTIIDSRNANSNANDALPSTRTATKDYDIATDKQAEYKYFRFEVTENGSGSQLCLTNMAMHNSTTPKYTATSGTDGIYNNFGYANLIDGNTSNRWRTEFPSGSLAYCEFQANMPVQVTGYRLTSSNVGTQYNPKVWTLKARLDEGDEWTTIDSRDVNINSGDALSGEGTKPKDYYIATNKQGAYKYFRFEVTENGGASQMCLSGLDIFGSWAGEAVNIVNPLFTDVTIDAAAPTNVTSDDGKVTFKGNYDYRSLTDDDKSILFLGAENTLYWPQAGVSIGAFRAYFDLGSNTVRVFRLNFGEGEVQGITTTEYTESTVKTGAWYTLKGVKLDKQPTRKGIYIHNGKKVVIK